MRSPCAATRNEVPTQNEGPQLIPFCASYCNVMVSPILPLKTSLTLKVPHVNLVFSAHGFVRSSVPANRIGTLATSSSGPSPRMHMQATALVDKSNPNATPAQTAAFRMRNDIVGPQMQFLR